MWRELERSYRSRFLLALACAIAIHEIALGLGSFLKIQEPAEHAVPATRVALEVRRRTPQPIASTPPPTPHPTATPPPSATPTPRIEVAAPRSTVIARHSGGSHGAPKLEVHLPKTVHHKETLPIWRTAPHASKTVAGLGGPSAGPSAGTGSGSGTGAGSGSGPGGGEGGEGSGAVNASIPCGSPVFYGLRAKYNPRDGSFDEDVRVELHLANGQTISGDFHYTWHYPSEADNPFSPKTRIPTGDPIPAQLPPPGFNVASEPTAVQLTLKYTLPNGYTRFQQCPS